VIYADIGADEQYVVRCCRGMALPEEALAGPAGYFGASVAQAGRQGEEVVVNDVATDPRFSSAERARLQADGISAFLAFMVVRQGRWVAMFGVHGASPRAWTRQERTLARMVGDRLWSAARRAAAETALRESEARFRALADASPAFIWQIDTEGQAVYLNRRYVEDTGLSRDELRGTGWHRVVHPEDLGDYLSTVVAALRRREPFQKRVRARLRDGSWHWFDTHAMPWFADDGQYRGHVGISIDITEAVRAEESLRDADRRKDEFLATLAHELRNPLAPISTAVHLLRHDDGRRRADQLVEMVGRQVRQVVRLVDDLMEVSRITRGKIELERKPVALAEVLKASIETSQPVIEQARHHFEVALSEGPLVVNGDRARLVQVFTNLLNNAAKYTDRGGAIRLVARREDDWAVVSVQDNGIGIRPEQLGQVFEMFVQVRSGVERSQGGLGIGLTMVRNLVGMHGGDVRAFSAGLGTGSVFTVRLPLLPSGQAVAAPEQAGESMLLGGRVVLVVDDNRDAADSLALLLQSRGARVLVAYDGPACLAVLERERPGALLLDIGMPGMSGHEVARRVRQEPRLAGVRIIALTGWGQLADREQSRLHGIDEHLTKPVDLGLLESVLLQCRPLEPGG
jgi:PAS domain S-box-containing protein